MKQSCACVLLLMVLLVSTTADADDDGKNGYLGIYGREGSDGIQIAGFIPDTPAAVAAALGLLNRGDVIIRIGATNVFTGDDVRKARGLIPDEKEAKMVLRNRQGKLFYVWISKSYHLGATATLGGGDYRKLSVIAPPQSSPLSGALSTSGISTSNAARISDAVSRIDADSGRPDTVARANGSATNSGNDTKSKTQSPTAAGLSSVFSGHLCDVINKGDKGDGGKEDFRDRVLARMPLRQKSASELSKKVIISEEVRVISALDEQSLIISRDSGRTREEYMQALEWINKAVQQAPDNANYASHQGIALYRVGKYAQALIALERSRDLHRPIIPATLSFLAMVHHQLGNATEARKYLKWAGERLSTLGFRKVESSGERDYRGLWKVEFFWEDDSSLIGRGSATTTTLPEAERLLGITPTETRG